MGRKYLDLSMRKKQETGEKDTDLTKGFTFVLYA
jgi:hypothetical protein